MSSSTLCKRVLDSAENPRHPKQPRIQSPEDEPVKIILEFIEKHNQMLQGTPEWKKYLGNSIGGSNIGDLYTTKARETLLRKMQNAGSTIPTNPYIMIVPIIWGNFFEKHIQTIIEIKLGTRIYGNNICIRDGYFRYSPDGLGVVSKKIILFEFKCPFTRNPDGKIPKGYRYQVRAGLVATEEITDSAMYCEGVFRRCSRNQLGNTPHYNRTYHSKDKDDSYENPVAWGVINIYSKTPSQETFVDYGEAGKQKFNSMLKAVDGGKLTTSLLYVKFADSMLDCHLTQDKHRHLVGTFPFKLMKLCLHKVERVLNDKQDMIDRINAFFEDVKKAI